MKRVYCTFLMLVFGLLAQAQNIFVKEFCFVENDLTARIKGTSMEDQNGNLCALIKVETTEKGLWSFDVGMLGVSKTESQNEEHPAEIWVYVPFGVTWISIQQNQLGKLSRYSFPCSIDKGCTYAMKLTTGKVKTIVEEEVNQQYLTFQVSPPNAMLEVEGRLWEIDTDGSATEFVDFGTYHYRVQAPNHHTEVGMVTVNDPEKAQKVTISLRPDLVEVTLKVEGDSEIWVNNEKKGVGLWKGLLGKGTYKLECKQANHETSMITQVITADMDGQTIILPLPQPIYGSMSIESSPNFAMVYLDGQIIGETPKFLKEILIGEHELKLTKEGCAEHVETITIAKGERKQVRVIMSNLDYNLIAKQGDEFYSAKNYDEALKCYLVAAEHGNAVGQNGMGKLYNNGYAVQQDYSEAAKWYRKAAEQGFVNAQCNLGWMYEKGHGVAQDYYEAVKWFRLAAERGYAFGINALGWMYDKGYGVPEDGVEAVKWYRKAADQGDARGQNNLGTMYGRGRGVPQDDAEAAKWYRKAAEQGLVTAQVNLGWMYSDGVGVEQDYAEALKWYRKAAEQGDAEAQCNLGYLYDDGLGVEEDDLEAKKWYLKSAEQGNGQAMYNLGFFCYENSNYTEAFKWYIKSAEQGNSHGQYGVGQAYFYGQGVKQDTQEGLKWLRLSAEQKNPFAAYEISMIYREGLCGVKVDQVKADEWYDRAREYGWY